MDTGYVSRQHLKDVLAIKEGEIDRLKALLEQSALEVQRLQQQIKDKLV